MFLHKFVVFFNLPYPQKIGLKWSYEPAESFGKICFYQGKLFIDLDEKNPQNREPDFTWTCGILQMFIDTSHFHKKTF